MLRQSASMPKSKRIVRNRRYACRTCMCALPRSARSRHSSIEQAYGGRGSLLKLPDLFGGKIRLIGAAYRAYPVFGKILKFRSRFDSRIRVSLFRVINVSTDGTDVSGHCILLMFKFRLIRLISRRIYRRLTTLNGMIIGIG